MAEKNENGENKKFNPDDRFRYVGFDVHQGKIGDLFKSDKDKDSWVKKVLDKRAKFGARLREKTSLDEPRVVAYEKIVMTVTSLLLVASLFMPWFSGYTEHAVDVVPVPVEETAVIDTTMVDSLADSLALVANEAVDSAVATVTEPVEEVAEEATDLVDSTLAAATEGESEAKGGSFDDLEKDASGFASLTGHQKRVEIRKEYQSYSAISALGLLGTIGGDLFSSGFVLMFTGILLIVYILVCVGSAGYTIYSLYGVKGNEDEKALGLKKALRMNWLPLIIWFFCLAISVGGASYSFDTSGMMKQFGDSYSIGTYLGLLGYGFYISLGCTIMNAVKAVEI